MNAKETKAKMDREVKLRKLIAKLDREIFGARITLTELQQAVYNENSYSCSVEPDGFHGKSYEAFQESTRLDSVKEAEERSYENDE